MSAGQRNDENNKREKRRNFWNGILNNMEILSTKKSNNKKRLTLWLLEEFLSTIGFLWERD